MSYSKCRTYMTHEEWLNRERQKQCRWDCLVQLPQIDDPYPGFTNWVYLEDSDTPEVWVTLETRDQMICDCLKAMEEVGDLPFTKPDENGMVYLTETIVWPSQDRGVEVLDD